MKTPASERLTALHCSNAAQAKASTHEAGVVRDRIKKMCRANLPKNACALPAIVARISDELTAYADGHPIQFKAQTAANEIGTSFA